MGAGTVRVGAEGDLAVRLFGGVEMRGPAGSTTLSGAKQRAIATRLALDAGRPVTVEQLVDSVWGEQSPQTVRASLQVHVSQIRRTMGDIGLSDAQLLGTLRAQSASLRAGSIDACESWCAVKQLLPGGSAA